MRAGERVPLIVMTFRTLFLQEGNPARIQSHRFQPLFHVGPIHQGETLVFHVHPDLLSAIARFDRDDGPSP
jgi:hypothetical protein